MNSSLPMKRIGSSFLLALLLTVTSIGYAAPPPSYYEVTNTQDYGSSDPVVIGSLRWAMEQANSDLGVSYITFDIDTATDPGCTLGGPCTIQPVRALPFLNSGDTEIDGYSHPLANEAYDQGPADIVIEIDGSNVSGNNGINVTSANNVVKGLAIHSFGYYGIAIYNPIADGNVIAGNHVGTDVIGVNCHGNGWANPAAGGILIENGAGNNLIGGTAVAARNIVACNDGNGVDITDLLASTGSTNGNQVLGNYIGDWTLDLVDQGNDGTGVFIGHGASENSVGDGSLGARNIIIGNGIDGVAIFGTNSTLNSILGNHIGVNTDASQAVANEFHGVNIYGGAHHNTVGGVTELDRNLISGNNGSGVRIYGPDTSSNTVSGNYIGTNDSGDSDIPNYESAVLITQNASANTIGPGNLISGNFAEGIKITSGAFDNTVSGNLIGTRETGAFSLENNVGIRIDGGANSNTIGGPTTAERNTISGNIQEGVVISGVGTDENEIIGNYIGTDSGGTYQVPNGWGVVLSNGPQLNVIGLPGQGNLISGNEAHGVTITGFSDVTANNSISGNYIGTDQSATSAVGNDLDGINVMDGAQNNIIGGNTSGAGNIISGNAYDGVSLHGADCTGNVISGNFIGTNASGTASVPNLWNGVYLWSGAHQNTIGGSSSLQRNVISGNTRNGVHITDDTTTLNTVSGNYIGTNHTGIGPVPNGSSGVRLDGSSYNNVVGGDSAGEGNVISGNDSNGIGISDSGTDDNTISGNIIGLNASGTSQLSNLDNGISIVMGPQNNVIGGTTAMERNVISGNGEDGIYISDADLNTVLGNYIGTGAGGTAAIGNAYRGLRIWNGASNNTIGPDNIIAFNGFNGIGVMHIASIGNVFTQNSIHSNSSGGIGLFDGSHNGIIEPSITSTSMSSVTISGDSSCPSCTVEVFSNTENEAQGRTYIGSDVTAGDGSWSLTVACISGEYLTATVTDPADGTSEFSSVFTSTVKCLFLPLIMK